MNPVDRFWSKVNKFGPEVRRGLGPCWEWAAGKDPKGYGLIFWEGKSHRAHRVSFYLEHGRWPDADVLHTCDNPSCVRSDHIFDGTHEENMADMTRRGRVATGLRQGSAKLTSDQVADIRIRRARGEKLDSIARLHGVTKSYVSQLAKGLWRRTA